MVTKCSRGHGNLKEVPDFLEGLTVYQCLVCRATLVEGEASQWVFGDPSDPEVRGWIVHFGNLAMDEKMRRAEIIGSSIEDPRWTEMSSSW
jgi:hypothetical protein